jgi:crotonobetainyl-CoA:carnitine CoA-transferase CaiB-like acyl-CoA transferase
MNDKSTLPLAGIKVLELGSNVSGPYGTWILAELGAEVWKVERPDGGDDARGWGPPFWRETATVFQVINRNKRSIAVDLKDTDAVAGLRARIIAEFDVVLQNLRPGAVERLGLDEARLRADKPALIYCNLWAFGNRGPLAQRPGFDALMQAFGGIMAVTGEDGRPPVRAGVSVIDMGTGMWCAIGILAALNRRHQSGVGGAIDTSLFETAVAWTSYYNADAQVTGEAPAKHGSGVRGITPYQAYECQDGWLVVAASNDRLFVKLADCLDHSEWLADDRFANNAARSENKPELNRILEPLFAARPRAHWQQLLDDGGVPNAPIQQAGEVIAHPQTRALGIMQDSGHGIDLAGLPLSFDGDRPPLRHIAPELGADTQEFLAAGKNDVE